MKLFGFNLREICVCIVLSLYINNVIFVKQLYLEYLKFDFE